MDASKGICSNYRLRIRVGAKNRYEKCKVRLPRISQLIMTLAVVKSYFLALPTFRERTRKPGFFSVAFEQLKISGNFASPFLTRVPQRQLWLPSVAVVVKSSVLHQREAQA